MSSKGFNDLPNELVQHVVHHVPDQSLSAVRLTRKRLYYPATDRFNFVFFSRRVYRFSLPGLKAFHAVTLHPILAAHIKEITFELTGRDLPVHHFDDFMQALENLRNLGNEVSLGLRQRKLTDITNGEAENAIPHTFTSIVETFLNTPIPVHTIMLDLNPSSRILLHLLLSRRFVEDNRVGPINLLKFFLEKDLDVAIRYYPTPFVFENNSQIKFGRHTQCLDASSICLDHGYGLKQAMRVMYFRKIRLSYCEIEMMEFTQFLFDHGKTLKSITFDNVYLYDRKNRRSLNPDPTFVRWSRVLSHIDELPNIEYCSFRNLWRGKSKIFHCAGDNGLELKGVACIRAGLTELLNECYILENECT